MPNWYYAIGEEQYGPVSEEDIQQMVASGELHGDDLLWQAGMTDWVDVQEVFPGAAVSNASEAPYPAANTDAAQTPTAEMFMPVTERQVGRMQGELPMAGARAQVHPLAVASVILAIASLFTCVTAIPAVIVGHMALAKINREPQRYEGKPVAIVGLVLGYLFLLPLAFVLFAVFLTLLAG